MNVNSICCLRDDCIAGLTMAVIGLNFIKINLISCICRNMIPINKKENQYFEGK